MENLKLFFNQIKLGFKEFGEVLSFLINTLLLFLVFVLGIGIIAIIAKLLKKKFLDLYPDKNLKSYWVSKVNRNKNLEDSVKPF